MRLHAAVIFELITALRLTTKLLYVFANLNAKQPLAGVFICDAAGLWRRSATAVRDRAKSSCAPFCHTQQALVHHSVPLFRRRLLIGRRSCLRRFLQVRDVGKVVLLGHTDGQSQNHHLPFAGSRGDKRQKTGQRWEERQRRPAGKDERGE